VDFVGTGDEAVITRILPRRNALTRPAAANIDLLVLVVSLRDPRPNTAVLDTMTVLAALQELPVLLALTKCDLASPAPLAEIYLRAGYDVLCFSPPDPNESDDLPLLRTRLAGKTALFAGNSGAGKSTLLNRLLPGLGQATAQISQKLGRGKHTTRTTELFRAGDMLLGDTPGFSALTLAEQGITRGQLASGFPEFAAYAGQCRFDDCAHMVEPGCAVRAAAQAGVIPEERLRSYAAFYATGNK
jgi:ribosome biogenesis GTPase